jgi:hypothetical protein
VSFRPLSALLTEPVALEFLYMESKWSSLVSYGLSLDALKDFLPLDLSLDVKTVRYDTLKVAKRLEAELGEDQASFIEGEPSEWDLLPPHEGFFTVGIDGGYVRNWYDKKHKFAHSTQFSGGVCYRLSQASRREDLQVEEPVACWDCSSFDFYYTLSGMLSAPLVGHQV